jgi:hypothetical protein
MKLPFKSEQLIVSATNDRKSPSVIRVKLTNDTSKEQTIDWLGYNIGWDIRFYTNVRDNMYYVAKDRTFFNKKVRNNPVTLRAGRSYKTSFNFSEPKWVFTKIVEDDTPYMRETGRGESRSAPQRGRGRSVSRGQVIRSNSELPKGEYLVIIKPTHAKLSKEPEPAKFVKN